MYLLHIKVDNRWNSYISTYPLIGTILSFMMLWSIFFMPTFYLKGLTSIFLRGKKKETKEKNLLQDFNFFFQLSTFSPNQKQLCNCIILFLSLENVQTPFWIIVKFLFNFTSLDTGLWKTTSWSTESSNFDVFFMKYSDFFL